MQQTIQIPVTQFDKRVVLISRVGNGKTTLFNKCCKQNQAVRAGGSSVTRASFSSKSAYGNGFNMLDTPGIGSNKDKIGHVAGIASAFAEGPVHLVLIIVRFQRTDEIKNVLTPMIYQQFKKYLSVIALAITFWDDLDRNYEIGDTKEQKDQIQKEAKQEIQEIAQGYGIKEFFTVSKNTHGQEICFQIDRILQKYNQSGLHLSLTLSEISTFFSILQLDDQYQNCLDQAKEDISTKFQKISNAAIIAIKKFDSNNSDMLDIMHAVCQQIKQKATEMIEDFQTQNMHIFNDLYLQVQDEKLIYLIDADLKCAVIQQINSVIQAAQNKMQDNNFHCYNFIKSCPKCKEVWMKVDGCDGEVTCGSFPKYDDQIIGSQMQPRKIVIKFTEKDMQCTVQNQIKGQEQKQYDLGFFRYQEKGCRHTDLWTNFNHLTKEQIQILKEGQMLDFLCQTVSEEKYKYSEKLSQNLETIIQNTRVTQLN